MRVFCSGETSERHLISMSSRLQFFFSTGRSQSVSSSESSWLNLQLCLMLLKSLRCLNFTQNGCHVLWLHGSRTALNCDRQLPAILYFIFHLVSVWAHAETGERLTDVRWERAGVNESGNENQREPVCLAMIHLTGVSLSYICVNTVIMFWRYQVWTRLGVCVSHGDLPVFHSRLLWDARMWNPLRLQLELRCLHSQHHSSNWPTFDVWLSLVKANIAFVMTLYWKMTETGFFLNGSGDKSLWCTIAVLFHHCNLAWLKIILVIIN